MTQFSLWLYPLILVAIIGLVANLRLGLSWSWGSCLQQAAILAAGASGFITRDYGLWAFVGWTLFFLFNIARRVMVLRSLNELTLLRTATAIEYARKARLLTWGPPGRYGVDMALAVDAFVKGDHEGASALMQSWGKRDVPRTARESLAGYLMLGRVIQRDWSGIIQAYEEMRREYLEIESKTGKSQRVPFEVFTAAARAYCEQRRFDEAVRVLDRHDLASYRVEMSALDSIFMAFFSLAGAEQQLRGVLARLGSGKEPLPEYARLYWLGRCYLNRGDRQLALRTFISALQSTPDNVESWRTRLQNEIDEIETSAKTETAVDETVAFPEEAASPPQNIPPMPRWAAERERAEAAATARAATTQPVDADTSRRIGDALQSLLDRARYIAELLSPARAGIAVRILIGAITVMFFGLNLWQLWPGDRFLVGLAEFGYGAGALQGVLVFHGQVWRVVTYLFLHASITHLLMNVVGLAWFGRIVERLYGTARFCFIYFGAGILSALAQAISSPTLPAIGASGAIMGVFGATFAAMLRLRQVIPANLRRTELIWLGSLALAQTILDQVINLLAATAAESTPMPRVAAFAHLGGMIAGFLLGLFVRLKELDRNPVSVSGAKSSSQDVNRG